MLEQYNSDHDFLKIHISNFSNSAQVSNIRAKLLPLLTWDKSQAAEVLSVHLG